MAPKRESGQKGFWHKSIRMNSKSAGTTVCRFRPKQTANGNYMAEVCTSQDGAFIALRLYQFINMNYEPVIGTCRFEGEKAQIIKRLF